MKRRPVLIVLGVLLLLGAGVGAFSASVWHESVEHSKTMLREAEEKSEASIKNMKYNDDKRPLEAREEVVKARGFVSEDENTRNAIGGGALVGLLGGAALIAVGARKRPA